MNYQKFMDFVTEIILLLAIVMCLIVMAKALTDDKDISPVQNSSNKTLSCVYITEKSK